MNQNHSLESLRKGAASLLALAVQEVFPDAKIASSGVTPLGFYVDVCFSFTFQAPIIVLIEEKMRALAKDQKSYSFTEMVPVSAAAFFRSHHQDFLADKAEESPHTLVGIIQQGGAVHLVDEPLAIESFTVLKFFKIKAFEKAGVLRSQPVTRLFGAVDVTKEALKEFLKKEADILAHLHQSIGARDKLFLIGEQGFFTQLPKGQGFLDELARFVDTITEKEGIDKISLPLRLDLIDSEELSLSEYLLDRVGEVKKLGFKKVSEHILWPRYFESDYSSGLMNAAEYLLDLQYFFIDQSKLFEEVISSLQFIGKILKILGFELSFSLIVSSAQSKGDISRRKMWMDKLCLELERVGPVFRSKKSIKDFDASVDFCVKDALDRPWSVGGLKVLFGDEKKQAAIVRSLLGFRQRMMGLLIEKHRKLPAIVDTALL